MHSRLLFLAAIAVPAAFAINNAPGADSNGKYWLYGDGISLSFIPYGASISNLLIKDKYGIERDIVAGFDNASYYSVDGKHPHFGGVPGRYANRIKNSTFSIDGVTSHVLPNENPTQEAPQGADTLHGGPDGWDWRNFTVLAYDNSSITFFLDDADGDQGFPGEVKSWITYTVIGKAWNLRMVAIPLNKPTPIMLSSHVYWNLDGFANNETSLALNHTFYLPHSRERVEVDNILIPTGRILRNAPGSPNDFSSAPRQIGTSFTDPALKGNCGFNCNGYDNCWLVNRDKKGSYSWRNEGEFVARLQSQWSGIQVDVYSDQEAFQMYSCNGQDGTMALKTTQGLHNNPQFPRTIPQYGCVVLEVEDWIDGINNPKWQRSKRQIFYPGGDPYVLQAQYRLSINETTIY